MVRAALAMVALPLLAGACACGTCHRGGAPPSPSAASSATTPAVATGETVVDAEDQGRTFDLAPGATLVFRLASHAGTGYAWVPAAVDGGDGGVLSPLGDRASEPSSDTPGGPKLDVYRYVARHSGTVTVEMDLVRPWEHGPPAKTLRVTVTVR